MDVAPPGLEAFAGYAAPVMPPPGLIYSHFRAPLASVSGPRALGSKVGRASIESIGLPPNQWTGWTGQQLVSWGAASVPAAARSAGIEQIQFVDYELQLVLMVYRRFTVEVHGD